MNSSLEGEKDIDIETHGPTTTSSIHEIFEEYEWAGQKRIRTISLLQMNPNEGINSKQRHKREIKLIVFFLTKKLTQFMLKMKKLMVN